VVQNYIFEGSSMRLCDLDNGFLELTFDAVNSSINVFNQATLDELLGVLAVIDNRSNVKGLLFTSAKNVFVAGADITEFSDVFKSSKIKLKMFLDKANNAFNKIEALPYPTVASINGFALGGGFELCLACDFRVISNKASVGLPETKLGIIPGWGGTVRLPRIIGFDCALEWILSGDHKKPSEALSSGGVDSIVEPERLRDESLSVLTSAVNNQTSYKDRRKQKQTPMLLSDNELNIAVSSSRAAIYLKGGANYPAPIFALELMEKTVKLSRDDALEAEFQAFSKLAKTPECRSLLGIFTNEQYVNSVGKKYAKKASSVVQHVTVLGAGIMGGGIAYQNSLRKFPVLMKDINDDSLALGMKEVTKLLKKGVSSDRISALDAENVISRITPSLSSSGIEDTSLVIEAVVESDKIKSSVLADAEEKIPDYAILTSNTSTICIDFLASYLKRPDQFCGMHFFNPVHAMPLVEIIRGEKTSKETIGLVVAHAMALGKKPIVVSDCPGFLVNRVLFPGIFAFDMMLVDGGDFEQVDKVIESWGWPMGPAYLIDVIGIDTVVHCFPSILNGYPSRMKEIYDISPTRLLFENNRFGQKNGQGYYLYEKDARGKPKKLVDKKVYELFKGHVRVLGEGFTSQNINEFSDDSILARFMVPMCIEIALCLEEGVVGSPQEGDMAMIYGLGFPSFHGGLFRWMDEIGLNVFCKLADRFKHLGKLYEPTSKMREMARNNQKYYS
jgi:3-hydroxyacyl-CoA dehydrogenase/enoyl-CoA hydratase/3-hydroxybutyryl-CoA epimerase/enoyl-CoA isomerase